MSILRITICLSIFLFILWLFKPYNSGNAYGIEYWPVGGSSNSNFNSAVEFNKTSTFKVKSTPIPWTEHEQKIFTAILSGTPPDIISQFSPLKMWASRNALIPLDKYIQKDDFDSTIFFKSLWKEMKWDGKTYGIPINTASFAFFYNKDIFDEIGITIPPENWEEVRKFSNKITKRNQKNMLTQVGYLPTYGNRAHLSLIVVNP